MDWLRSSLQCYIRINLDPWGIHGRTQLGGHKAGSEEAHHAVHWEDTRGEVKLSVPAAVLGEIKSDQFHQAQGEHERAISVQMWGSRPGEDALVTVGKVPYHLMQRAFNHPGDTVRIHVHMFTSASHNSSGTVDMSIRYDTSPVQLLSLESDAGDDDGDDGGGGDGGRRRSMGRRLSFRGGRKRSSGFAAERSQTDRDLTPFGRRKSSSADQRRRSASSRPVAGVLTCIVSGAHELPHEHVHQHTKPHVHHICNKYLNSIVALSFFGIGALVFTNTCEKLGDDGVTLVPWTFVDTIYFGIVTITTTGYGDLLPTSDGAKLFACAYAYVGVSLVASLMGRFVANVMEKNEVSHMKAINKIVGVRTSVLKRLSTGGSIGWKPKLQRYASATRLDVVATKAGCPAVVQTANAAYRAGRQKVWRARKHLKAAALVLAVKFLWALFFSTWHGDKGNELDFTTAVYYACISMTSVGYGEFSPNSQDARLFAIFVLFLGCVIVTNFFGGCVDDYMQHKQAQMDRALVEKDFDLEDLRKVDRLGTGSVTEVEFFSYMIAKMGKVTKHELHDLRNRFAAMDHSGDGTVTREEILQSENHASVRVQSEKINKFAQGVEPNDRASEEGGEDDPELASDKKEDRSNSIDMMIEEVGLDEEHV